MSYDLFLYPEPGITVRAFAAHFSGRLNYKLDDSGTRALYENENTGTYFSFEYVSPDADGDPEDQTSDDDARSPHVAFNMNYFRPHVFGLEAAPHVSDFVETFNCAVDDPQVDGMGKTYNEDGFIAGWNSGNQFGYGLLREHGPAHADTTATSQSSATIDARLRENGCLVADARDIKRTWLWNYARTDMECEFESDGDDVFVPRVFWAARNDNGKALNFAVWGEGVPTLIPDVASHVVIALTPPASRGLLGRLLKGSAQNSSDTRHFLVPRHQLAKLIEGTSDDWSGLRYTRVHVGPEELPEAFLAELQDSWPKSDARQLISVFQGGALRDAELVAAALSERQ